MQKYKANLEKNIENEIKSNFNLVLDKNSSKRIVQALVHLANKPEDVLQLKNIAAEDGLISVSIDAGLIISEDQGNHFFSFDPKIPLKIRITDPVEFEFNPEQSWHSELEFTDILADLVSDSELTKIVDESLPPPIPVEEDPEAEWKKLKKGIKRDEDPSLTVSIFNFLNKYYQNIPRKEVDKQLELALDTDASYVENFIIQTGYYFLEIKKHKMFQQTKLINEQSKGLLRANRNANLEDKIYTYSELDKMILDFGLAAVVQQVRSGNWIIEDELEDKDIIKLLSKGIITQQDIEDLYLNGGISGIEFEKVITKKKLGVRDLLAHKKMIEDIQISEEFKDKQKQLLYKNNPDVLILSDDLNALKVSIDSGETSAISLFTDIMEKESLEDKAKSKKLEFLILNYQIRLDQVVTYLSNPKLFTEESNQIILSNPQIIIDNAIVLFRMTQHPLMKPEVKKTLEDRLTKVNNKQEQLKMVSEFKKISESGSSFKSSDILSILDKADQLYLWAKNYDDTITSGISFDGPSSDQKYDKEGFEVLSTTDISRVLFNLMKLNPSSPLIEYIYSNDSIPYEFKIQKVLENPACPLRISQHYVAKNEHLIFILKNPLLPAFVLETIVDKIYEIVDYNPVIRLILAHPHCSSAIASKLKEGVVSLMDGIKNSKDSQFIYDSFVAVYNHPANKKYKFEITPPNQYRLLEACVRNAFAPKSILKYFISSFGLEDQDVQEIVLSHPNLDLEILSSFVARLPQNENVFHSFKHNPNWKDLSVQFTKNFFETKKSISKTIPLVVMDTLQKFQDATELAIFLNMDKDSEAFEQLLLSFEDFKYLLKTEMIKKHLIIAKTTNSIEQLRNLMLELKHPDFGFFQGVIKITDSEKEQLIQACRENPILKK